MQIKELVKENRDYVISLRRHFHQYPELSMEEYETSKKIKEELDKMGIEYRSAANTGIIATIKGDKPGKTIALRADMDDTAYENRPEIRSLELATQIYKQKVNVTRAEHLPSIALMGNYMVTNPSVFNSFENKFKGMWNVGVMVQIPIWHWGEGIYKTRAAKAEARIAQYQLQDAREKIELQVNQAAFKVKEAGKKLVMSSKNMEKAEENLRYATLGFKEGVIATSNVLEAQTAWLSAHSEKIDAQIDMKLTEIYLKKSLGTLK